MTGADIRQGFLEFFREHDHLIVPSARIVPAMAEDQSFIEMFIDEAKIVGHLSHANIAGIYELGKVGKAHYIAMEYVWGKDLLQIMNRFRKMRKQMPASMGAWIGAKMCEGLDYAHRKKDRHGRPLNIIHRDVSPQNALVSYEGQVKIRQGTDQIDALNADVVLDEDYRMKRFSAKKDVVLTQPTRIGKGDQLEYEAASDEAVLTGNLAMIEDREHEAVSKGARLTLHLRDAKITASDEGGAKRVKTTHRVIKRS